MDLQRIGIKFLAGQGNMVELVEFIPIFHRWIQEKLLDNLLIDVADYSHVHAGPGIVLVAHEGNYAIDETGNRCGMLYYSKQGLKGDLSDRINIVCRNTLLACHLLEKEESVKEKIQFPGNEMQFFANDRLLTPNTDKTHAELEPLLKKFLDNLFAGTDYRLERETGPKERYQVTVKADKPVAVDTLLERLGS